jgi:hypothetical protein
MLYTAIRVLQPQPETAAHLFKGLEHPRPFAEPASISLLIHDRQPSCTRPLTGCMMIAQDDANVKHSS